MEKTIEILKELVCKNPNSSVAEVCSVIRSEGIKLNIEDGSLESTISAALARYSDNTTGKRKSKEKYFTINSTNPNRYSLIKEPEAPIGLLKIKSIDIESLFMDKDFLTIKMKKASF